MSKPNWNDLTPPQRDRLKRFALKHGKRWKGHLTSLWATGRDAAQDDGYLLRQIRNTLGPEWLSGLPNNPPENI